MRFRSASIADVGAIKAVFASNAAEQSLFQQSAKEIQDNLAGFFVVENSGALVVGCVALHQHGQDVAEIYAVAVVPWAQGQGVGKVLLEHVILLASNIGVSFLWLATMKVEYFAKFGFQVFSKWKLPKGVLRHKLKLIFRQRPDRWIPEFFGRHTFMKCVRPGFHGGA